ncbi:MAG: hypothetical protein ACTSWI_01025 [Alphaproteobacteria bacterium]
MRRGHVMFQDLAMGALSSPSSLHRALNEQSRLTQGGYSGAHSSGAVEWALVEAFTSASQRRQARWSVAAA